MLEAKQERARIARKRIIEAAEKLFGEKGFDATSTEEIALAAGVSKGTIFAHFGDKLYLLAEAGQGELARRLKTLEDAAGRKAVKKNPLDLICKGIDHFLDYFEEQPDFLRLFVDKSALDRGELNLGFIDIIQRLHIALKGIISNSLASGQLNDLDPELTAVALRAYIFHMAVGRLCGEYKTPELRKQELRALASALLKCSS